MAAKEELKICYFAFQSRYVLFWIQLLSNTVIPDHKPDVFNPPIIEKRDWNFLDVLVNVHFGGFIRWDAIYFIHIAEYGYTFENCLAFFPFYPLLIRVIGNSVFFPLQFVMTYRSVLILSAFFINQIIFVKCAVLLYQLGLKVLNSETLAYKAALLFCINPASVFMSAAYSECLFACLTFSGMLKFEKSAKTSSAVLFGFTSLTRSNGIVNIGFELHHKAKQSVRVAINFLSFSQINFELIIHIIWSQCILLFLPTFAYIFLSIMPFFIYQYFAYSWFCSPTNYSIPQYLSEYASTRGYHIVGVNSSSWCFDSLPLAYSAIQKNHWGVGFLQYYQLKQIPNFVLATPVTLLSISCAWHYWTRNKFTVQTLDLYPDNDVNKKCNHEEKEDFGFENKKLLPYIIQLVFLTIFGWLFMHVQVTTRFLFSSSPVLYWFAASVVTTDIERTPKINKWNVFVKLSPPTNQITEKETNTEESKSNIIIDQILNIHRLTFFPKLLLVYFLTYFLVGTVIFSNFFPWT